MNSVPSDRFVPAIWLMSAMALTCVALSVGGRLPVLNVVSLLAAILCYQRYVVGGKARGASSSRMLLKAGAALMATLLGFWLVWSVVR
jgi:hypothetical protein